MPKPIIIHSAIAPGRSLRLYTEHNTPPSAPPLDTTRLSIHWSDEILASIVVDPIALRLAVLGGPSGDHTRSLTADDGHEIAEDRVAKAVERLREVGSELVSDSYGFELTVADLAELVAEVAAWRTLAGSRLDVINRLAEDLAQFVDPAPQGDPITAGDD